VLGEKHVLESAGSEGKLVGFRLFWNPGCGTLGHGRGLSGEYTSSKSTESMARHTRTYRYHTQNII
jgi:hypothetical protein